MEIDDGNGFAFIAVKIAQSSRLLAMKVYIGRIYNSAIYELEINLIG